MRRFSSDLRGTAIEPLTALEGFPLVAAESVGGYAHVSTAADDHALLHRTDGTNAGTVLLHRFRWGDDDPPDAFTEFAGAIWCVRGWFVSVRSGDSRTPACCTVSGRDAPPSHLRHDRLNGPWADAPGARTAS